jgi:hypothetical protein
MVKVREGRMGDYEKTRNSKQQMRGKWLLKGRVITSPQP